LYHAIATQRPTSAYIFNGGTGMQSSTKEVVTTVSSLLPNIMNVQWGKTASRPWEPTSWQADPSLAHTVLGWQPRYSLKRGLAASLMWFEQNLTLYNEEELHVTHTDNQSTSNTTT
jgi:nucleoside-diphosphate-sugar epimerase